MNRRWLITISLLAHVGLGIGLFAAGVWRIERLEGSKLPFVIGVPFPSGAEPEGGSSAAAPAKPEEKKKKRVVKDAQPMAKRPEAPEVAAISTDKQGEGDGAGKGSATGDTVGPPGGERCDDPMGCIDGTSGGRGEPVCGNGSKEAGETCDDGNASENDGCSASCRVEVKTILIPPTVLAGLRIAGETQIHAPDTVKTQMLRDGRERSSGTLKLCIATDGGISSVSVVVSTKYDAYDAKLVAAARSWRYRPYTVNGTPMPVCGVVTFVYTIR